MSGSPAITPARAAGALSLVLLATAAFAGDDEPPPAAASAAPATRPPPTPEQVAAARRAFPVVARVLLSPRCSNCHPAGDAPLQGDAQRPHRMNITRLSASSGLACSACHQERNSERVGVFGGPPGAPHWDLPPEETPMVFEGRSAGDLCRQLHDRAATGDRDLDALLHHVETDALVLWAWEPGGRRTQPPVSHARFAAAFRAWVDGGGACP
jgi:hypothetical protein